MIIIKVTHLPKDVKIAQGGHVRVGPCVNANLMPRIEGSQELAGVPDDVNTNHEMGGA